MAMCISAARQAMPLSRAPHAQRSKAKRQRHRAARLRTPAPGRIVRTRASGAGQPEPPPPAATPARASIFAAESLAIWVPLLTGIVSILTIIWLLRGFISDSSNLLTSQLAANSRELAASNSMLTTKLDSIGKDVVANTASIKEFNTKLDTLNTNLQAQQVKTAELQGQVTILREGGKKKCDIAAAPLQLLVGYAAAAALG